MSFTRSLARAFGVEKQAAKLFGKSAPHDGSRMEGVVYTADPRIDRIVFICGLHRSGTTLLERLLVADYEVACLRGNVPESEGQHLQSVFAPASDYGGPGRFAFNQEMQSDLQSLSDFQRHREKILDDWGRFVVGDSNVLMEKSPPNLTKIWWLRKVFPGSRFIVMTRDPRAVAGATQKWSKNNLTELVAHWDAAYGQALTDILDEDCTTVRYEDLVEAPRSELQRLADFAGLSERAETEQVEKRHSRLINSNADYIESFGGQRFGSGAWEKFGYSL